MSDEEDYSSEDDLDYVPSVGEEVSEEDGSGDEEDVDALKEDAKIDGKVGGRKERRQKKNELAPRKRQGGIKLDDEGPIESETTETTEKRNMAEEIAKEKEEKKEESEKKKADNLWASFLSDVGQPPKKTQPSASPVASSVAKTLPNQPKTASTEDKSKTNTSSSGKMTITKVFDFAGEEVKITKEVDVSSKEAQEEIKKQQKQEDDKESQPTTSEKPSVLANIGVKRPASSGGGLGGLLNKLGKKPKISVLDKSKMDWDSFKKDEGIEDDLKIHNRGKESYLERMAFLNRADVKQFEIEKSIRLGTSKR